MHLIRHELAQTVSREPDIQCSGEHVLRTLVSPGWWKGHGYRELVITHTDPRTHLDRDQCQAAECEN